MYLRRVMKEDGYHYLLRSSYWEDRCWKSRDLFDLGPDPGVYIEYVGGNGFYFTSELEDLLQAGGIAHSTPELEDLFLPFLPSHIRRAIGRFQARTRLGESRRSCSPGELAKKQRHLHSFDKRRLHFLRCGRVDIGELEQRPWKFLRVLMEKSRDEIEHVIEGMENILRPHEMRPYLFTALHLQARFPNLPLRHHPAALDRDAVDDHFVEALCALNRDESFFAGVEPHDQSALHHYLVRYLVLYFDSGFPEDCWQEQFRDFVLRQEYSRYRQAPRRLDIEEACRLFGISREKLTKMERSQLVRLYRRKAKELHPDRGGDQESFIRMAEAFACLMESK